jgi:hypothetical protein
MSTNPQVNYKPAKDHVQTFLQPSETVPGQSMTVLEIMRRFASGIPPTIQNNQNYDTNDLNEKNDELLFQTGVHPAVDRNADYSDLDALSDRIQRGKDRMDRINDDIKKAKKESESAKKDKKLSRTRKPATSENDDELNDDKNE